MQEGRDRYFETVASSLGSSHCVVELSNDEIEKLIAVINTPLQFDIPEWFLNRQKDVETGKYRQVVSNNLQANLREDLNRLKKMR